ncbi:MAG TPA: acetate--CoA ligase family protein [Candidatus Paceibacterota bacterium]
MALEKFFDPQSVAVIGASDDKNKVGFALLTNLHRGGQRAIYPVNINRQELAGVKSYPTVKDIPATVDLAVIAVRADIVPQILADCGEKKITAAIVISAGFKEIGAGGQALEEKIVAAARDYGITLLGPNCLGIIDTQTDFNASFAAQKPPRGEIAFLSQSGALGAALLDLALEHNLGFSKFISLGNEAQLSEIEFLAYLAKDAATQAILIYLEKLSNGPEFIRLCTEITKTKPVVILRAGRSARGRQAVMSHTGSLAPASAVFAAAGRQAGVMMVESIRELFNLAKLFQLGIKKPLSRLAILTNGGGPSVVVTDLIDLSRSLSLVELSAQTQAALRAVLPPMAAVNNPVDIIGDAPAARYAAALNIICAEKDLDGIILILTPQMMTAAAAVAELIVEFRKQKPILPVFVGGPAIEDGLVCLKKNNLANFTFPKDAVEALNHLARGAKKPEKITGADHPPVSTPALTMMEFAAISKILGDYGIELAGVLAKQKADLAEIIPKLGAGPFALKIISSDIIHKTDSGAVKLNLKNIAETERAWDEIIAKNPGIKLAGGLVQPMISGKEMIIGLKRDPTFGPTILFGWGGIFAEILKDTVLRLAPVSPAAARLMIQEIKGVKILTGHRGEKSVDLEALAEVIVKISNLAVDHPEIQEMDLNPVMATPEGAMVIDVRIMV